MIEREGQNMAVKPFNCNKIKRTFWPFILKDKVDEEGKILEKGKQIIVRMPQKGVFEAIKEIQTEKENENGENENIDQIYSLLVAVLNNNMEKTKITAETLEDYDIEECNAILEEYMKFVDELKTNPN